MLLVRVGRVVGLKGAQSGRMVNRFNNWANRSSRRPDAWPVAKVTLSWGLAQALLLVSIALAGCGVRAGATPIEPGLTSAATTIPSPQPTATRTSSPTVLPSATSTPSATPTNTPTSILFAGTELVPLDSLSSGEPFVGELTLLREIVLPGSTYTGTAFIQETSELIYRYGQFIA